MPARATSISRSLSSRDHAAMRLRYSAPIMIASTVAHPMGSAGSQLVALQQSKTAAKISRPIVRQKTFQTIALPYGGPPRENAAHGAIAGCGVTTHEGGT